MDFKGQERHYRRGLILGLTLAEVMLLVLFALLLVLLDTFSKNKPLSPAEQAAVGLVEELRAASAPDSTENDFRDVFESLAILVRSGDAKEIKALTDTIAQLRSRPADKSQPRESSAVQVALSKPIDDKSRTTELNVGRAANSPTGRQTANSVPRSTNSNGDPSGSSHETPRGEQNRQADAAAAMRERIRAIRELAEAIQATHDVKTIHEATQVTKLLIEAQSMLGDTPAASLFREAITRELKSRADAAKQVHPGGPGTEHPSCWVAADTGKPEYIFDVTLASGSVLVHDNALPHRAKEQAALPIGQTQFDRNLGLAEFVTVTDALYRWSEAHDCRFFVRIIDKTEGGEKAVYKRELRTVGEHFYYFEDLSGAG